MTVLSHLIGVSGPNQESQSEEMGKENQFEGMETSQAGFVIPNHPRKEESAAVGRFSCNLESTAEGTTHAVTSDSTAPSSNKTCEIGLHTAAKAEPTNSEPVVVTKGAPQWLLEAKTLLKNREYEACLEKFSFAVESKLKELGETDETHPEMGVYFLEYGDALLLKAESSNELFRFATTTDTTTIEGTADSSTSSSSSSSSSKMECVTKRNMILQKDDFKPSDNSVVPETAVVASAECSKTTNPMSSGDKFATNCANPDQVVPIGPGASIAVTTAPSHNIESEKSDTLPRAARQLSCDTQKNSESGPNEPLSRNEKDSSASPNEKIEQVTEEDAKEANGGESPAAEEAEEADPDAPLSDEQLAWEVLELAKKCFERKLQQLESNDGDNPVKSDTHGAYVDSVNTTATTKAPCNGAVSNDKSDTSMTMDSLDPPVEAASTDRHLVTEPMISVQTTVTSFPKNPLQAIALDNSYVRLRLGDLLMLEEQFESAVVEFQDAINILTKYGLKYHHFLPATIALAQAQLFAGQSEAALGSFKSALQLARRQIAGDEGSAVPEGKLHDFQITCEDLELQISELLSREKHKESQGNMSSAVDGATFNSSEESSSTESGSKGSVLNLARAAALRHCGISTIAIDSGITTPANAFDKPRLVEGGNDDVAVVDLGVVMKGRRMKRSLESEVDKSSPDKPAKQARV